MTAPDRLFAVTAPGLEDVAARELATLGAEPRIVAGGVEWDGGLESAMRANLHLRTASRVVVRVAEFRARTFFELERHGAKVPWSRYLAKGQRVALRVSSAKSKLYHEGAIEERLLTAIVGAGGTTGDPQTAEDEGAGAQLFIVRFLHDRCTISADSSGALLHRRGYREEVAKAPLRETLAAAMLLGSGWTAEEPLLDPMCGAGTIPIEAALMARRIAPGLAAADRKPRRFRFEEWPEFRRDESIRVVARAEEEILRRSPVPIFGSDRDEGAVSAARGNATRAGVLEDLSLSAAPLTAAPAPEGEGLLISNPPYGLRVGETPALRNLYAAIGRLARERLAGWRVALLTADRSLEAQLRLELREVLRTQNGGIPVRLVMGG